MLLVLRYLILTLLLSTHLWAENTPSIWYEKEVDKVTLNVELFLSSSCPHCHKAEAFFNKLTQKTPWLHIHYYNIDKDKNALVRFNQLLNDQKASDFAIPSLFLCNSRWVGFASAETTGNDLLHALDYCKQQIEQKGELTTATVSVLRRWANANLFVSGIKDSPTQGKYLAAVALMDALNPCALFVLGGFFAILVMQDRTKKRILAGSLFIIGLGLTHFIQQVFANAFYQALPWLRWTSVLVGLLTLFVTANFCRKNSNIPSVSYIFAFVLGIMIQAYQQTCLMNWSYIFQQWLYNQPVSYLTRGLFQLAYQLLYLIPLVLCLILYSTIIKMKRLLPWEKRFQCVGFVYLLVVGLFLIIYPSMVSHLFLSLFVLFGGLIAGLFWSKFRQ